MTITRYGKIPEFAVEPILLAYRGSVAHGMYIPNNDPNSIDDIDLMGVYIGPKEMYFGLKTEHTKEVKQEQWDIVLYGLRHFVSLLSNGNPNVLSMLYVEPQHVIKRTKVGNMLIQHRKLFMTQKIKASFRGYAYSQLKKMTAGATGLGYMGERRRKLVEQFGYDTKNAAHLIRLLRMGQEALSNGRLFIDRSNIDAPELLDIKLGRYSLGEVQKLAEVEFRNFEEVNCLLPEAPDEAKINELLITMMEAHFGYPVGR